MCRLGNLHSAVKDVPKPSKLQLSTTNKISVIEHLAYKNKAHSIILQTTHPTTKDKLVIPNFSLGRSVLSRKHGVATFVH